MNELVIKGADLDIIKSLLSDFENSYNDYRFLPSVQNLVNVKIDAESVALKLCSLLGYDFDCEGYIHEI